MDREYVQMFFHNDKSDNPENILNIYASKCLSTQFKNALSETARKTGMNLQLQVNISIFI